MLQHIQREILSSSDFDTSIVEEDFLDDGR